MNWLRPFGGGEREHPVAKSIEPGDHASSKASQPADLESLLALALQGSLSRQELWPAVCAFTEERQRHGEPIEKILVPLKEAVAHARALSWPTLGSTGQAANADDVAATVVRCCIEHFYRNPDQNESKEDVHAPT